MHGPQPNPVAVAQTRLSWAWLPLTAALILGAVWLVLAFAEPYAVQDDARQHVVWFEAFRDPGLFRGDFIATYFIGSNTPVYKALYQAIAWIGISPLFAAKLFPVAITLLTGWLAYRLILSLDVGAAAAGFGALLFLQGLWVSDDIASATARAFSWPLLLAVLVAWREERPRLGAVAGFILALTYPSAAVFAGGVIGLASLCHWRDWRSAWIAPGVIVAGLLAGALTALALGAGGDLVSPDEARQLAEFQDGGRTAFFVSNPITYWLLSKRTGFLPEPVLRHALALVAALGALWHWRRLPVELRRVCIAAVAAGAVLWAMAHLVLFSLYLPGRYTLMGFRMAVCVLAGVGITAWLSALRPGAMRAVAIALAAVPLLALAVPPRAVGLVGMPMAPAVMDALRAAPPTSLVAGFSSDLDFVPSAALRRVLTAREYHLLYNRGYGQEMRRRVRDTAVAVFADGPEPLRALQTRYGVTHLLLERHEMTAEGARTAWWWRPLDQMGVAPRCDGSGAGEGSTGGNACRVWALEQHRCIVAEQGGQVLLAVDCLLGRPKAA